ncbi:MAG: hypothetical protein ACKV2T_11000 [Kofleriaceae bacterium]
MRTRHMRLVLALPSHLSTTWIQHGPDQIAMRSTPAIVVVASVLLPLPDDVPAWMREVQHANCPAGSTVTAEALVERETTNGWPFRIATARLFVDQQVVAVRIGAFFSFLEHVASARVTFPSDAIDEHALVARVEDVLEIFGAARPDFSSQIAGLHQLWR